MPASDYIPICKGCPSEIRRGHISEFKPVPSAPGLASETWKPTDLTHHDCHPERSEGSAFSQHHHNSGSLILHRVPHIFPRTWRRDVGPPSCKARTLSRRLMHKRLNSIIYLRPGCHHRRRHHTKHTSTALAENYPHLRQNGRSRVPGMIRRPRTHPAFHRKPIGRVTAKYTATKTVAQKSNPPLGFSLKSAPHQ
jgi:hypothetical protein